MYRIKERNSRKMKRTFIMGPAAGLTKQGRRADVRHDSMLIYWSEKLEGAYRLATSDVVTEMEHYCFKWIELALVSSGLPF
jgi:hypothetical protein